MSWNFPLGYFLQQFIGKKHIAEILTQINWLLDESPLQNQPKIIKIVQPIFFYLIKTMNYEEFIYSLTLIPYKLVVMYHVNYN